MSSSHLHVIIGLGITGLSCAHFLREKNIPFIIMDTRLNPPQLSDFKQRYPFVAVHLGELDHAVLDQAQTIVVSPGVALHEPAMARQMQRGVPIIGDIELFARTVNKPVIAITGTNAKSTVTTLVGKMAEAAGYVVKVGGNLGVPALDLLASSETANLFVLELSSFQLETTFSLHTQVATILNVTSDHMDRYQHLTAYQQAKQRIYQHCHTGVCNLDDALTDCQHAALQQKFYFTLKAPQQHQFGLRSNGSATYLAFEDQLLLPVQDLPVMGKHYQANALAALAIGHGFGLSFAPMLATLREFKGLPHRCQWVREHQGIKWYNDSKGTNVGATQAAIEGLGSEITGKLLVIAGGVGKNADFSPLKAVLEKYARHVVLMGEAANEIAFILGDRVPHSFAANMEEAVLQARAVAKRGDSVLLSPACASFDMFKHYAHRGDVFMEIVNKLR